MKISKFKLLLIGICIILFIIPFFWMKPGEMDLGGDGSRLYYYDPATYLSHDGLFLFDSVGEGVRSIEPHFSYIPYVLSLIALKTIIPSSFFLISLISGLKLSLSFLSVYLIVVTMLKQSYKEKKEILISFSAILAGLFYICTPIMIGNYDKALLSQSQVFLNPLFFYILLIYFLTQKFRYLMIVIVASVVFAPSFSWVSAPPLFSFFPLAILFLLIYVIFILKKKIILAHVVWGIFFFFLLHAFHLVPELYSLFRQGSYANARVFDVSSIMQQINYFYGILPSSRLSLNFLEHSSFKSLGELSIIVPFFVIVGFAINRSVHKIYVLTGFFFLITLYLITANITSAGVIFYEKLFYIPGFSMFRNFVGQWAFVFAFFYALLFGQAILMVFKKIKQKYVIGITIFIGIFFILSVRGFIVGNLSTNKIHFQSKNVKIAMKMDPQYEKALGFIKTLKDDGSIISFPFTDYGYSVIHGKNNGAYVGISPITLLTGKKDYDGYGVASPFGDVIFKLVHEKDYESIKKLLGLLNIRYIFYNSDPLVYDTTFPGYPYNSARQVFPNSQKEYMEFVGKLVQRKVFQEGPYALYEIDSHYYLPHFYTANSLMQYDNVKKDWYGKFNESFFVDDTATGSAYIGQDVCRNIFSAKECEAKNRIFSTNSPTIVFERINPTKYKLHITNATEPYFLVFSETFHKNWQVFLSKDNNKIISSASVNNIGEGYIGNQFVNRNIFETFNLKQVSSGKHIMVNGYANGWLIDPTDVGNKHEYTLIVEMVEQRVFYISLFISLVTVAGLVIVGIYMYLRHGHSAIIKKK